MYELGLVDEFLKRPHQEVRELSGRVAGERRLRRADRRAVDAAVGAA